MPSRWFERAFAIAAMLYFSGGVLPLFRGTDPMFADRSEIDPVALSVQVFFYSITLLLILRSWRVFLAAAIRAKWILALVLLAGLSVAWSNAVPLTARHAVSLAATTAFAIYFGSWRTRDEQVRTLVLALLLAALLSALFVLTVPEYGLDMSPGHRTDWRGIYFHKNTLGRAMLLGFVSALALPTRTRRSILHYAALLLFAVLMFLSASLTCMAVAALMAAVLPLYRMLTRRIHDGVAATAFAFVIAAPFVFWVASDCRAALALVGRDVRTGRLPLWRMVLAAIEQHPWLGYGYDGFWLGVRGDSGPVANAINFVPAHAHNGFLDLALQLGIVGLVFFAIGYFIALKHAYRSARYRSTRAALWPLMALTVFGVYNLAESALLKYTDIFWVVCAAAAVSRGTESAFSSAYELLGLENAELSAGDANVMPLPRPPQAVAAQLDLPARHA